MLQGKVDEDAGRRGLGKFIGSVDTFMKGRESHRCCARDYAFMKIVVHRVSYGRKKF